MRRQVLLVDPGQDFAESGSRHSVRQTPHIGLCYLAAVVRGTDIADVKILDMPLLHLDEQDLLREYADLNDHDVVGITTATFNVSEALRAAELAKQCNPTLLTVLGGPHVNAFPTDALERSPHVDLAVAGEAEKIFTEIVKHPERAVADWDLPGVARRVDGDLQYRPITADWVYQNLDELPFPDWEHLGLENYAKRYSVFHDAMMQVAPLSTNRGCPYQCSFCDGNNLTNRLKYRTAMNTIEEIRSGIDKYGLRHYYITDSVMCIPKPRFMEFCELMVSTGLNREVSLIGQAQVNSIDEETIRAYAAAGGEYIFFGLESGNEEVLKRNGKRISKDRVRRIVNTAHECGLHPRGSFILGLPFDTKASVEETIAFSQELKLHSANFFILDFYPGTRAKTLLVEGDGGLSMLDGGIDWDTYVPSRNQAAVKVNDLTPEDLSEYHRLAKSLPLKYEDKDLTFRQNLTELVYALETGSLPIPDAVERAGRIDSLEATVSAGTLDACRERRVVLDELLAAKAQKTALA